MSGEKKLIEQIRKATPKSSYSATGDFVIPNHSGDLSAGDVLKTPVNDNDVVNKKYVDDAVSGAVVVEADPLAIHKDGSVALTGNWNAGNYKLTLGNLIINDGIQGYYYADGTYTVRIGQVGSQAGYFSDGTYTLNVADGTRVLNATDGTRTADLVDSSQAGYFSDASSSLRVGYSGYAVYVASGNVNLGIATAGFVKSDSSGDISIDTNTYLTSALQNVVEDTTPQLGGTLDAQENLVDNVGDLQHDDTTASDWNLINQDQDRDILIKANDGGTERTAILVNGDEGSVTMPRQSYVKAHRESSQTIANNTYSTVIFDTVDTDVLGEYNNSTGIFTAKDDGVYAISVITSWDAMNSSKDYRTIILDNGGYVFEKRDIPPTNTATWGQPLTYYAKLTAGQNLRVQVYQNSGGNETLIGGPSGTGRWCCLVITKIS